MYDDYWIDAKKTEGLWVTSDGQAVLGEDTDYWNHQQTSATAICTITIGLMPRRLKDYG